MGFVRIRAVRPEGRFRAGRFWPAEGVVLAEGTLDDDAQAAIEADPYLRIEPADAEPDDAGDAEAAKAEIVRAISDLPPEAFGGDGKPRLDALRAALPSLKISAALRDEVWAEAKAAQAD